MVFKNKYLYALIRKFEGCRLVAYLCPAGVPTIGYGSTGPDVKLGDRWTLKQAEERMASDAEKFQIAANRLCPAANSPEREAALADFAYNLGATRLAASTLRRKVNKGDWAGAQREIKKWVWGGGRRLPGLVLRRGAEAALLAQGGKR